MPRGGARPGAGRKAAIPGSNVEVNWRLSAEARDWIKAQAKEQGTSIAAIIEALIDTFESSCK
jgi:hypothetical protein